MLAQRSLDRRLAAAGVDPGTAPWDAWQQLRAAEGPRATGIELYALVARERGLAPPDLSQAERTELAGRANAVMWPEFEHIPSSVTASGQIQVVPYDPAWRLTFTDRRDRLERVLGSIALGIHHVGSTSVPGLAAKPIVDVMVCVPELEREDAYVPGIESLGLAFRSRDRLHRYFRPAQGRPYDVHVHVCERDGRFARDHLLFRDYLRNHRAACEAYEAAKHEAARVWADDRWAYTEAKTGVILDLLEEAERWAQTTRWTLP